MLDFTQAAVVGAGTMGHGIAYLLAKAHMQVILVDQSDQALRIAKSQIENILDTGVAKGRIRPEDADEIGLNINYVRDFDAVGDANVLIEAVSEDIELKQHILSCADALMDEHALLASNTSSLSIGEIASKLVCRERFLGLHFFNPPHIMKLLEIVLHEDTSSDTVEQAKMLGLMLRKECIIVNDSPGFATSRLGISFALEAIRMLEQGVTSALDLDAAMKLGYGHPMGPLMLSDWVGLDIRLAISEHLHRELDTPVFEPPNLLRRMVRAGLLGKKSGTGFYEWDKGRHLGVSHAFENLLS